MGLYKQKYNAISGQLNLVPTNTIVTFKESVANAAALPLVGNSINDGRITDDTGHLYIWNGTSWVDSGDIVDLQWSAIDGKPSSSAANIDDAVSKKHTQGTDQGLDTGGANAVTAAQVKTAVTNSHAPHSDDQVIPTALADLSEDTTHRVVTDTEKGTWNGKQAALGFTPEDVANKSTNTSLGASDTLYPTQNAVKTYITNLGIDNDSINLIRLNMMLDCFRLCKNASMTLRYMIQGFMDAYVTQNMIDLSTSVNETYNSSVATNLRYYTPCDEQTKLLLHMDEGEGGGALIDTCGNLIDTYGGINLQTTTAQKKFGISSALFSGTPPYWVQITDSDDFYFANSDFTIDFWVYLTSNVAYQQFVSIDPEGNSNEYWWFGYQDEGGGLHKLRLLQRTGGVNTIDVGAMADIPLNTWTHVALVRNGVINGFYFYVNGTQLTTLGTTSNPMVNFAKNLNIGRFNHPSGASYFVGYMDEFRISKGVARWTTNFTPPTSAYNYALDLSLVSKVFVTDTVPVLGRFAMYITETDAVTVNTDIKAYISRDDGATWSEVTLEDKGVYDIQTRSYYVASELTYSNSKMIYGTVDISAQPSGTNLKYKIESFNNKRFYINGVSIEWK